jgi:hypothetical protein
MRKKERAMPDDGKISGLYERDFYAWSGHQAKAIRAVQAALSDTRVNDVRASLSELDWENLAEEIETLGRSDRRWLARHGEPANKDLVRLAERRYTPEQILNDWWPDAPA